MRFVKLTVLGSGCSGKTTLTQQFLHGTFTERHRPTVEDHHQQFMYFDGQPISVVIADTSGTFSFPAMQRIHLNSSDGFVIVYETGKAASPRALERALDDVAATGKPCVVVRNKIDIASAQDEEGLLAAEDILKRYSLRVPLVKINASCRANYNVEKVFSTACQLVLRASSRPRTGAVARMLRDLCEQNIL